MVAGSIITRSIISLNERAMKILLPWTALRFSIARYRYWNFKKPLITKGSGETEGGRRRVNYTPSFNNNLAGKIDEVASRARQ